MFTGKYDSVFKTISCNLFWIIIFNIWVFVFFSNYFKNEFIRYGIPNYRKTTGFFQSLGGASLFVGIFIDELGVIASLGLTILMLLGVIVRLRINDGLFKTMPAIFYAILNALIFYLFLSD